MPGKLTITVGIPGSGKTTEAFSILHAAEPGEVEMVSRDDLRHLLYQSEGILSGPEEKRITEVETDIVKAGLRKGKHVVVHDMNLRSEYRTKWARVAFNLGADFVIKDLTHVDVDECFYRDYDRGSQGGRSVGEKVIRELHKKFVEPLKGEPVPYPAVHAEPVIFHKAVPRPELPPAVIVDIDGTVASHEGVRSPYDASRYQYDVPRADVVRFVRDQHYKLGKQIVFCSGRHSDYREVTEAWLNEHVKVPFYLVMREDRGRDDSVEKYYLFDRYIRPYYNAEFVLDDRDRVVQMWRQINLPCYQVQDGDF